MEKKKARPLIGKNQILSIPTPPATQLSGEILNQIRSDQGGSRIEEKKKKNDKIEIKWPNPQQLKGQLNHPGIHGVLVSHQKK